MSPLLHRALAALELSRGASLADVERSRRRLLFRFHPDRGGDPADFRRVQDAYSVLVGIHERGGLPAPAPAAAAGGGRRSTVQLGGPAPAPPRRVDPGYFRDQEHLESVYGSSSAWGRGGIHREVRGAHVKRRRKG